MNIGRKFYLILLVAIMVPLPAFARQFTVHALFKDMAVISLDGKQHTLTTRKPGPEGIRLIRSNSYQAEIVVNGKASVYTVGSHPVAAHYTPPEKATLRIWPDSRGMYRTSGNINGMPVDFLVDTGASVIAMNENQAKSLGLDASKGQAVRVSTASGSGMGYQVKLDTVRVGTIEIQNVDAVVLPGESPEKMLLGMSFLSRVKMERSDTVMVLRESH